jgi:hypothetical protein
MESPHEVFPGVKVYSDLASNRTIDLCEQGGWNLHKIQTAQVSCRYETRKIADHSAA